MAGLAFHPTSSHTRRIALPVVGANSIFCAFRCALGAYTLQFNLSDKRVKFIWVLCLTEQYNSEQYTLWPAMLSVCVCHVYLLCANVSHLYTIFYGWSLDSYEIVTDANAISQIDPWANRDRLKSAGGRVVRPMRAF